MKSASEAYYDASYFAWQCAGGEFSALLDQWKFAPYLKEEDSVLDFGCGGGFMLSALRCQSRYGIEVNPSARATAARLLQVYAHLQDLPDGLFFDAIISHHALEHVGNPLDILEKLFARLKPGGKIIFVVPSEDWRRQRRYDAGDVNHHLYTWTPLSLGNLFAQAGYVVERVELLCHSWVPVSQRVYRLVSPSVRHLSCQIWAFLSGIRQVRIVASRPKEQITNGGRGTY